MGCCLSKKPCSIPLSSGTSCDVPVKPDVNKPTKPVPVKAVIELRENPPAISEENDGESKDVLVIKHEKWKKKTDSEEPSVEKSFVSCTKEEEEVDAILIQCGKLSRSNSAAKNRRYSGSKRSFDFDQNERTRGGGDDVDAGKKTPQRNRVNGSPRRRTPSRERGGGSRRVSRSPGKRSEATTNTSGSLVNSRPGKKFVTVRASNNREPITVKRSIGEACRTAATSNLQPPPPPPPPRKAEQSPYRRNPLGEIDQNKKVIKRVNESAKPPAQVISRSLRKSKEEEEGKSNYTALLLKDIKSFHGESHDDDEDPFKLLPSCVTKACSIVEAVADLNSKTCLSSDLNQFRFTSTVNKKGFEKYVTVRRRGGCSLEEQDSSCG